MIDKIDELEKQRCIILDKLMTCAEDSEEYQKHCQEISNVNEQIQEIIDEM